MYLNPHTGAITGIYADMWRELARWEKKELIFMKGTVYGGYTPDPVTGKFDGILGWLQDGTVDGISEDFTYRIPIEEAFYERTSSQVDDINNFIVFTHFILALIIISFAAINLVERTVLVFRYRLRFGTQREGWIAKKYRVFNKLYDRVFNFLEDFFSPNISWDFYAKDSRRNHMLLYIIGSLFFALFYSAVFAGNAVVTVTEADIHLKELIVLFQSDAKTLLMRDLAYIKRNTLAEMFGRDVIDPFGNFPPSSLVGQGMYGKERPVTFYMVELWWKRYTNRPRSDTTPKSIMSFDPIPIYIFKTFLIICGCFYGLSIAVFVIEIIIGKVKQRRNNWIV
ncbi:hypothetical protein PRIPAC_91726 [Pristionchus pacificus]|uniref:Uncharacterized protein n=1 Tax=Pristionchus pacificus TaxID=54126 RepID=A0A2A6BAK8_PRIPA|nr:hypothetical protein PRIPAC_91726 [Pristionchus pacificus]|eukprot:PDM62903.1 hypothetical protein PRIPAC_50118 [Pristionchus pacificus]